MKGGPIEVLEITEVRTILEEVRTILTTSIVTLAVAWWRIETDRGGI